MENRKAFKATQPVPVFSAKDREVFKALYDEVKAERSKQKKLQAALAQQQAMQEQRAKELAQKELEKEMEKEMEELFGLPDAEDEKERQPAAGAAAPQQSQSVSVYRRKRYGLIEASLLH